MDPTQDPTQGLDQQAIDAALDTYQQAATQFNNAKEQYDYLVRATDAKGKPSASQGDIDAATTRVDNARTQLGAAARAYSSMLGRVADQRARAAQSAKDPNEQRLWANEADKASSQRDLYSAEADMYQAKTQADIDNATTRANAALQNAQSRASRVESQNDQSQASALLANARAAAVPALTADIIRTHTAQIQKAGADAALAVQRAGLAQAQTAKTNAQTEYLLPAQVDELVQRGLLDQAKADQIKSLGPAKLDDLVAKGLLDRTKVAQIQAQIAKWSVLPATDRTSPTLVEQQPSTGDIRGVPNPGYVNQTLQGITDTNQAIQQVQSQIANGQMTPEDGTALINNLRQALQYKSLGVTPDQYVQMQDQQAQLGRGLLNDYMGTLGRGQDTANTFLSYASRARGLPAGVNFTPFSTFGQIAQNVYGPSLQKAQDLINQVQPVTDKFSALHALSNLAAAKSHLEAASTANPTVGTNQANPMDTTANPTVGASNPTVGMQDFTSPSYARTGPGQ